MLPEINAYLKLLDSYPTLKPVYFLSLAALAGLILRVIYERVLKKIAKRTDSRIDDRVINITKTPVFWTVLLVGAYFSLLEMPMGNNLKGNLLKAAITLALLVWFDAGARVLNVTFEYVPFLKNMSKIALGLVIIFIAMSVWKINITPALASAGVLGIALAFAAKDTVANLFGGVSVFFDKPYKVGDYIIVEGKYRGEVVEIGIRSTKVRTRDNLLVTVPNSVMITSAVINETGFDPKLRIRIPLGLEYGADLEKIENLLIYMMKKNEHILEHPEPRVRYRNFGDSAIELEVIGLIKEPALRGRIIHTLIKEIDLTFKGNNIKMPFPQRDIHIKSVPQQ